NKRHVIWTSHLGVMIKLLKAAQKPKRRARTEEDFMNDSTTWPSIYLRGDFSSHLS
ncbi:unnamed protein product, partial [Urochloa humidicola]